MCVFFCGGSCIEDISTHLMYHLSSHPKLKTCSADTILSAIKELTVDNTTYTSLASGKSYDFNTADIMNELLVKSLLATRGLRSGQEYDLDFDHQFIQTEKYDAKRTYKKFFGYSPGVAVIGDNIVGIERLKSQKEADKAKIKDLRKELKKKDASTITVSEEQRKLLSNLFPDIDSLFS